MSTSDISRSAICPHLRGHIRRCAACAGACRPSRTRPKPGSIRWTPWVLDLRRWLQSAVEPFDLVAGMTICLEPLLEAGLRFARRRGIPFVVYPLTHLGAGPRPGADALSRFYTMRPQVALVQAGDPLMAQTPTERAFDECQGCRGGRSTRPGPGWTRSRCSGGYEPILGPPRLPVPSSPSWGPYPIIGGIPLIEAMRVLWREGCAAALAPAGAPTRVVEAHLARLPEAERRRVCMLGPVAGMDVIDHGRDGLLVPFGDVRALAEALQDLLGHL